MAAAAAIAAYELPALADARDPIYNTLSFATTAAIWLGIWLHRPARPLPWILLGIGAGLQWLGDVGWSLTAGGSGSITSPADVLYLLSYLPIIAALAGLLVWRGSWRERTVLLDAWIAAFTLGFVAWIVLIEPATSQPGLTGVDIAVIVGYPVLDLVLLAMAAQLVLDRRRWDPSLAGVVCAVLLTLVADMGYVAEAFAGTYRLGDVLDVLWLAAYAAWGFAALHPSMARVRGGQARREGLVRVLVLGAFALVPLATLLVARNTTRRDADGAVVTTAIVFVLIAVRLWGTILRLQAEMHARRSAEDERDRLAQAIEQSAEAVFVLDERRTLVYANPAFRRLSHAVEPSRGTSAAPDEAAPGEAVPARARSGAAATASGTSGEAATAALGIGPELLAAIQGGEPWSGTREVDAPDGTRAELEIVASPVFDASGRVAGCVGVARDVTRQHTLERQLKQAERLESLGRLAGGVAHDFNNLLTAIRGFAELLLDELGDDPRVADVREIEAAAERGSSLTHQLLVFSRGPGEARAEPLDVNRVVADMVPLLGRILGEDVRISVVAAPEIPRVLAERGQFEQVLLNLASNARDAMPSGGSLAIETSVRAAPASDGASGPEPGDGGAAAADVTLTVSDTGTGMDRETRRRVFDPFFTTKPVGKGTGLGLSTVYAIVRKLGGSIDIDSAPGRGTRVSVRLPGVVSSAPVPATLVEPELPRGSETILLVEDQDAVREFIRRALERLGYRVLAVPGPDLALRAIHDAPRVDLLFTDVIMPGMSGPELASRVAGLRPELAVLFASGHAPVETFERAGFAADTPYLSKPFTLDQLALGVRSALDEAGGGARPEQVPLGL